ncbi:MULTISPECIES: hypothetical protein [Chromobacteriaceae]|uniref:Uncharacterized protein n=2 Tax=Chromobacteriaceae TaxID=1499392 RepID=A0ABV0CH33_9NEIS|nr:hypothetical protein [Pseudogulbenkiania ferrooxidans]ERE07123.1 hypothetical protein O166_01230 [Pseudogulbenkiania ferrooxidans EGD-HP2]
MADDTLHPDLRQISEQYLGRTLQAEEMEQLLALQQNIQSQPPAPLGAAQQAKQQAQLAITQNQARAGSSVKEILQAIQTGSAKALQVQETEEQAILKLLESSKTLAELRPAALQQGGAGLRPSTQLVMAQIGEQLAKLARAEVKTCFDQYFGPLNQQLQMLVARMEAKERAAALNAPATAAPGIEPPAPFPGMPPDAQEIHKPID